MPFQAQANPGAFIETTALYDVAQLYEVDVKSPEFKELLVRLYQSVNNIALLLNIKDSGYYPRTEFVNGQAYFPDPNLNSTTSKTPELRQVFRLVINFGALPNAGLKSVAHGLTITNGFTFTRIYAAASDTTGHTYIPIPYASPVLANNIEINVDAVNVNITTGSNRTNYNVCYVVLEYIKE